MVYESLTTRILHQTFYEGIDEHGILLVIGSHSQFRLRRRPFQVVGAKAEVCSMRDSNGSRARCQPVSHGKFGLKIFQEYTINLWYVHE